MPEKKKPNKESLPEDQVRLKPFLGIRPGHYLACIYALAILVILFFILLYPGISNPGSLVTVKSEPWGAAVLVDGVYKKAAPCEIFVSKGLRKFELKLPGFNSVFVEENVGGRIFASALFPRKSEIWAELKAANPARAFVNEAAEYAAWAFTGEPSAAYQIPLSLSEGAYRFGPGAADPEVRKSIEDTITAAARFAVTRAGLRDLIRAKTILDNQGLSPSPLSLLSSAEDIIDFLGENPAAALWLGALLTDEAQSALIDSSWYAEAALAGTPSPPSQSGMAQNAAAPGGAIQIGLLRFQPVQGGLSLLGGNFPPDTSVDSFYISETPITEAAWEAFLREAPEWKKENADSLIIEGLVTESYLETISGAPLDGVQGISWHAAAAFCRRLSASLPPQFSSWEVRLPAEAEWEYAAKARAIGYGSFWEWCADPYAPLSFLSASREAAALLGSPERPLRGGSWINPKGSVGSETRASLPPSFCSPFVSFRPVIAPRASNP